MTRKGRQARPKGELEFELREQIQLLRSACGQFDQGFEAVGKHISLSLRVLLLEHGQSRSLLEQLGLRDSWFFDSAGPLNPRNLMSECNLVGLRFSPEGGQYMPLCAQGEPAIQAQRSKLVDWWNLPVCKTHDGSKFSRRELVQHVANTDGGAHVDPDLDEQYIKLSRANGLGWTFGTADVRTPFANRPQLACMRQIAFEVLKTLEERAPSFCEMPAANPSH